MNHLFGHLGLLGRLWRLVLETSEVAVTIHYGAPWGNPGFESAA